MNLTPGTKTRIAPPDSKPGQLNGNQSKSIKSKSFGHRNQSIGGPKGNSQVIRPSKSIEINQFQVIRPSKSIGNPKSQVVWPSNNPPRFKRGPDPPGLYRKLTWGLGPKLAIGPPSRSAIENWLKIAQKVSGGVWSGFRQSGGVQTAIQWTFDPDTLPRSRGGVPSHSAIQRGGPGQSGGSQVIRPSKSINWGSKINKNPPKNWKSGQKIEKVPPQARFH